jgi:hypothetical protein
VIGKAEVMALGNNPRLIVTNLSVEQQSGQRLEQPGQSVARSMARPAFSTGPFGFKVSETLSVARSIASPAFSAGPFVGQPVRPRAAARTSPVAKCVAIRRAFLLGVAVCVMGVISNFCMVAAFT